MIARLVTELEIIDSVYMSTDGPNRIFSIPDILK